MKPYAVFAVAKIEYLPFVAAVTRPEGGYGLPGGKVEDWETPVEALEREALEEGWSLYLDDAKPIHEAMVDGKMVHWFVCGIDAIQPKEWKERSRGIFPVGIRPENLTPGFGNEFIKL